MIQIDPASVAGLVLAGGEGRRLGGVDKGLVPWNGRPMAAWAVAALSEVVTPVWVGANRSLESYAPLADEVFTDAAVFRGLGPLAGLLTAMNHARDQGLEALLVTPCDTPDVTDRLFGQLLEAAGPFPQWPVLASVDGRRHPLHGVYPVALAEALTDWLGQGERRVQGFVASVGARYVDCSDFAEAFTNRNTPDDFPESSGIKGRS